MSLGRYLDYLQKVGFPVATILRIKIELTTRPKECWIGEGFR